MAQIDLKLGEILVLGGYISHSQLEEVLAYKDRYGCMLQDALIQNKMLSKEQWEHFMRTNGRVRLGDRLVEAKLMTTQQLRHGIMHQKMYGGRLGNILVDLGYVTQEQITTVLWKESQKKLRLGDILLQKGVITQEQLEHTLMIQRQSGGRMGEILLFLKYVTEEELCREIATQQGIGCVGQYFEPMSARKLPYEICWQYQVSILYEMENRYVIAVKEILNSQQIAVVQSYVQKPIEQVLATTDQMNSYWEKIYGKLQLEKSIYELYESEPDNSAYETLTKTQKIIFGAMAIGLIVCLLVNYRATFFVTIIISQLLYMAVTALKLYIVKKGASDDAQLRFTKEEIGEVKEAELPIYTLLIPVYKEAEVIGKLIDHIDHLDYPQYKLDVCILLEQDDEETRSAIEQMKLPSHYRAIVVPTSEPKTKPKACNYGLVKSKGEYV